MRTVLRLAALGIALAIAAFSACGGTKVICSTSTCSGCCDVTNMCQPGTTNFACGISGAQCTTCSGVQSCFAGTCIIGGSGVGGGTGHAGGSATGGGFSTGGGSGTGGGFSTGGGSGTGGGATGTGGGTSGTGGGTSGTGGGAACTSATCPAGCCLSDGNCVAGTIGTGCGWGGEACEVCSGGPTCQSHACVSNPPANGLSGAACGADPDCRLADNSGPSTQGTGDCILPTLPDGGPTGFVGGYCNPECGSTGGVCVGGTCVGIFGGNYCVANCASPKSGKSTCRTGYVCDNVTGPDGGNLPWGICFPNCNNTPDGCGTTATCLASGYCQ